MNRKVEIVSHLKTILKKSDKDDILTYAASLTYTTVLSFIPIIAIAYYAFDVLGGMDEFQSVIENFISDNMAPHFADQIVTFVHNLRSQISPNTLGLFGVFGFLVAGVSLLLKVESSLNLMWKRPKSRPWIKKISAFGILFLVSPICLAISLTVTTGIFSWLKADTGEIARLLVFLSPIVPYVSSSLFIGLVYYWLPAPPIKLKTALVSGAIAGVMFETAKYLYAYYAVSALKGSIYGSLAVAPVFLLWMNLMWIIFLFGAEVCCYFEQGQDILSDPPAKP